MSDTFLFKQGYLNVKRGLMTWRKHVCLAAPVTMEDVQKVFETCFVVDPYAAIQNKSIPYLGNISFAAARGVPLMIMATNDSYEDPVFIPLDSTFFVKEEEEMEKPCNFEINIDQQAIGFAANSSVDYQFWIEALQIAYNFTKGIRTTTTGVTDVDQQLPPQVVSNTSQWLAQLQTQEA